MRKSSTRQPATTVDGYLQQLPSPQREALKRLRAQITSAAPEAEELISYQIPSFKHRYMLVGFAAFNDHLSFFVMSGSVLKPFKQELASFKTSAGTIQFTHDRPLPPALVNKLVKARLLENEVRWRARELARPVPTKTATEPKPKAGRQPADKAVQTYLSQLKGQHREDVEALRKMIKIANKKLSERIKWNAPSFFYKDDIVTFGPYKTHKLLLVFHHPAVVNVVSPLLEGTYKDRRLIHFESKEHAAKNKKEVARIINEIIKVIDKK